MNSVNSLEERTTALTVSELAELLSLSERQIYKLAAQNRIPSFKVGGSVSFDQLETGSKIVLTAGQSMDFSTPSKRPYQRYQQVWIHEIQPGVRAAPKGGTGWLNRFVWMLAA